MFYSQIKAINLYLLGLIASLLFPMGLHSQTIIQGKLVDQSNGNELPRGQVYIKGSFEGVLTNLDGSFDFTTSEKTPFKLIFNYLGYRQKEIEITTSQTSLRIELESQTISTNEVVITSSLQEEVLQEVPISVAVVDQKFISRSAEIDDPGDLIPYVPGFAGKNYSSAGSWYTIRGINSNIFDVGAESKVAIFHDGAYNGRSSSAGRGFFDIERVEVIKGPQGTLFGRNATAGVIDIHSHQPKFYKDASLELTYGNWGQKSANYMLNIPFSDKFAMRYAGKWEKRDGLLEITNLDNHQNGKKDILTNRLSFLWLPNNKVNVKLKFEHQDTKGGGTPVKSANTRIGASPDPFDRQIEVDFKPQDDNIYYTAGLHINWILNNHLSLSSISTVNRNHQKTYRADLDGSPSHIIHYSNPNGFTNYLQEIRLNGKTEKMDWLIAGSFFADDAFFDIELITDDSWAVPFFLGGIDTTFLSFCPDNPMCIKDGSEIGTYQADNKSYAMYGNLDYALTPKLNVTLGLRYTIDDKAFYTNAELGTGAFRSISGRNIQGPLGIFEDRKTWSGLQPRVVLDYTPKEHIMIYASYNRGYLAGGFNNDFAIPFDEETNNAYEIGIKSSLINNRLKLNLATYFIDYQNLQAEFFQNGAFKIQNAGKVESKGIELESAFMITKGLGLMMNAALNDSKYKSFIIPAPMEDLDFSGNVPNRSPKIQASIIGQYSKQLSNAATFFVRADYSYQSREFYDRVNLPELSSEGYGLLNGSLGFEGMFNNHLNLSLYAYNITNQNFSVHIYQGPFRSGLVYTSGMPRLFGLRLKLFNLFNWQK